MSKSQNIFAKVRLRPDQMRAVAERRFADAECLLKSGDAQRANGAIYLAGLTVECFLKALLLERHPNLLAGSNPSKLSPQDKKVFLLIYQRHELDVMCSFLPELEKKLSEKKTNSNQTAWREFQGICEEWSVYVRYSPSLATIDRARRYIATVREIKQWLKRL